MQTEKSKPSGQRIMPETKWTSFPALPVRPRVGISRSASETDDRFYLSGGECTCFTNFNIQNLILSVHSNSRNDVPRVAQRYGTIAAHTRRRASVRVVFVVLCVHMYSFAVW